MTGILALCMALSCGTFVSDTTGTSGPRVRDRFAAVPRPHVREQPAQAPAQRTAQDRWLAVDKAQHFAMAYGTAMFGYGVLRGVDVAHDEAQMAALGGSLALGVAKELIDRRRGGPFSFKDLAWDALGTLAAWGILSINR